MTWAELSTLSGKNEIEGKLVAAVILLAIKLDIKMIDAYEIISNQAIIDDFYNAPIYTHQSSLMRLEHF